MQKRHQFSLWVSIILLTSVLLAAREMLLLPDGRLHLYVLDVGQGDSILLVSPSGKQIIIDGGPDLSLLTHLGTYMPFFDHTIELVILTHPDLDHIAALPEVLRRYSVKQVALTGVRGDNSQYAALLSLVEQLDISVLLSNPANDIIMSDGLVLDILSPTPEVFASTPHDLNAFSFVLRALFGNERILLTGDSSQEEELKILRSGADVNSDIMKVAHHGSRTASSTGFLLAVHPSQALISFGEGNTFGHPHMDVMDRYHTLGIRTRTTAGEGTLSLSIPEEKDLKKR